MRQSIPFLSEATIEQGESVFVRVDFNVPLVDGKISDDTRIQNALPTLRFLVERGAKVIVASHLGRPKGPDPQLSLKPVAQHLAQLLSNTPVHFVPDIIGDVAQSKVNQLQSGEILLLENLRFEPGEKKGDPEFAKRLASYANVYVNDAFGTLHRKDASVFVLPSLFQRKYVGFLVQKELEETNKVFSAQREGFILITGGAKVADKLPLIQNFLPKVETILIGGGMAFTFLRVQGFLTGSSLYEEESAENAKKVLAEAKEAGVEILLPVDYRVAKRIDVSEEKVEITSRDEGIISGWMGLDIGPKTENLFHSSIIQGKTILWNGPMGVFEHPPFSKGTFAVAKSVAQATLKGAYSLIGGGDTALAVELAGVKDQVSYVSTGGGALLTYLSTQTLPGLEALVKSHA